MPDLRELKEFIKDTMGYVIALAIFIFVFTFIVAVAPIAGNSMNPTLNDGDMVIVSRFTYKISKVQRNDIIIFKDANNKKYVKRIIGLPGEKIDYINGYLIVNGETFEENISTAYLTNNFLFSDICSIKDCPNSVIPDNKYLVLGDARDISQDSRDHTIGLVDKKDIIGEIVYKIWPISNFGIIK
ncbi:MAG: signal peptidase I [Tenericutes bacterium]|nr:signal peptidase I [Mycoplasmatota bacterium]